MFGGDEEAQEQEGFVGGQEEHFGSDGEYEEETIDPEVNDMCRPLFTCCLGFLIFPCVLYLLGWNEKSYVCADRRLLYSETKAEQVGCNGVNSSRFAFFSCPLYEPSLQVYQPCTFNQGLMACDHSVVFKSVAGAQTVEMYQCMEKCETTQRKENGKMVKRRKCTCKMDWSDGHSDSSQFKSSPGSTCPDLAAASGNPPFPDNLQPGTSLDAAQEVQTADDQGRPAYTLNHKLLESLAPDTPVNLRPFAGNFSVPIPGGLPWTRPLNVGTSNLRVSNDGRYLETCTGPPRLGCVRISYSQSSATSPSVLATVSEVGATGPASIPGSWGCSSETWQEILAQKTTKQDMVQSLRDANSTMTWVIRILGIAVAVMSVCCCLSPCAALAGAMGECLGYLPCGGECLGDALEGMVDAMICLVSCPVGVGASLIVMSIVWVAMRPAVGISVLCVGLLLCCCAVGVQQIFGGKRGKRGE